MKYVIAVMLALSLTGCAREITIENEDAYVSSVGPLALDEMQNVVVHYTLRDPEGDDQNVQITVCEAPDQQCGVAVEGLGGDPTTRVPTIPADTDVPHEFRWSPWCGRWQGENRLDSNPDEEYVVGITIRTGSSDTVYSEPFTLSALGTTGGDCAE